VPTGCGDSAEAEKYDLILQESVYVNPKHDITDSHQGVELNQINRQADVPAVDCIRLFSGGAGESYSQTSSRSDFWVSSLLLGESDIRIDRLYLDAATSNQISACHPKYSGKLASNLSCALWWPASRAIAEQRGACIVVDDPYHHISPSLPNLETALHTPSFFPSIHPTSLLMIQRRVTCLLAHLPSSGATQCWVRCSYRGALCWRAGRHQRICGWPLATVGDDCSVGQRCILHSGVVLGADGFGCAAWWSK
jgi:hypothetical protein